MASPASYLGTDLAGRYRLERLIGEGVSSWVFAATDLLLEREVAVKVLKPNGEPERSQHTRFVQEARTLAKLAHPHVVAVHDAGTTSEGQGYLVMELSRAGTLDAELAQRTRLELEEVVPLFLPLLGALACAHDHGIIHRDLKPGNIALARLAHGRTQAKLLDFGISHAVGPGLSPGELVGTPAYMAPEQARGEPLGPAADVWAIGVILFRCLSGSLPFEADSSAAVLRKLVQQRAELIGKLCPQLPPRVAIAIDRALEPDPTFRYQDARGLARALGLALRQDGIVVDAHPDPIGLPDFSSWLERADLELTLPAQALDSVTVPALRQAVDQSPRRAVAGSAHAFPSIPVHAQRATPLWTLALLLAVLIAGWSVAGQSSPRRERARTAEEEAPARPATRPEPARQPPLAAPLPSSTAVLAPAAPGPATTPTRTKRSPRSRSHGGYDILRPAPQVRSGAANADESEPGLITNWEW